MNKNDVGMYKKQVESLITHVSAQSPKRCPMSESMMMLDKEGKIGANFNVLYFLHANSMLYLQTNI